MAWIITALALLFAWWAYLQYRHAQQQTEAFRLEAKQRMQELASLGYSENKVGRRVAAIGDASLDAIIICKADHSVIYLNPVAEALFSNTLGVNHSLIAVTRQHEIDKLATDALAGDEDLERQLFLNSRTYRARAAT